jgi:hypothetical protein
MRLNHLIVAGLLAICSLCHAQNPNFGGGGRSAGGAAGPTPSVSAKTQGMKKFEGYYTFYHDEKDAKIWLEIPLKKLNEEFLYVNSLPSGGAGAGDRGNIGGYRIAKFTKTGSKVFMVLPNYDYRAETDKIDEKKSVEGSFPQSIIWGFRVEAADSSKVLVDLTAFLMRDSHRSGDRVGRSGGGMMGGRGGFGGGGGGGGGGGTFRIDETRSALLMEHTKSFPKNTEFEVMLTFTGVGAGERSYFSGGPGTAGSAPDPSAITLATHHSFIELPDKNYQPREFDPRSGFNSMDYFDFAVTTEQPLVKKYIRRWRLEKKDPNAAMSEAVKPIIYYVDRGAPDPIKKALIEGASWWNKAFEAAGFQNAFQVKELPADADPMDIRYSVINWVHRPVRGMSSGMGVFDPRTGEIIKGQVTLGSMRDRQDFLVLQGLTQAYGDDKNAVSKAVEMALARIKQLSAHEVGHTLGLYHNHMASSNDRSSVTDYPFPRFTLKADGTVDISDAYSKNIGSYDKRSIIWGYATFPKKADEKAGLEKIMQESLKQGQVFMFDIGVHPHSAHWDNSNDPAGELNRIMDVRKHVLSNFSEKAIPVGAPMATLEEVLVPVYLIHRYEVIAASHLIGGMDFRYALRGDGQFTTKMLDPKEQWKAFDAIVATITPDALALPEKVIRMLPPYPVGYARTRENFKGFTGSTFDPIAAAESSAAASLDVLFDGERAARLLEFNARDEKQPGLLPMLDKLIQQTWKTETVKGYKGEIQSMVRKTTLKGLLGLAANARASENVRAAAMVEIEDLKQWLISQRSTTDTKLKGDVLFSLSQIGQFEADPSKFKPADSPTMPPGAPI